MTEKQYPELPEPTAWRTYDNLLKRARYNAMPITSMQPGIYSHTRMFTEDQMYAYVDADRAMRTAPASQDALDDAAVDALAVKMKSKLAQKRAEGYGGWDEKEACDQEHLSRLLRKHVNKGDPVDVANFCAFLSARGEGIAQPETSPASQDTARLDWLTFNISGKALRDIGVEWSEHGDARRAIDAARARQEGK